MENLGSHGEQVCKNTYLALKATLRSSEHKLFHGMYSFWNHSRKLCSPAKPIIQLQRFPEVMLPLSDATQKCYQSYKKPLWYIMHQWCALAPTGCFQQFLVSSTF